MNRFVIITWFAALTFITAIAQEKAIPDSLENLLDEVVVTAKHTTKMDGNRLVTTIPGTSLSEIGNAYDVLRQLPLIKVDENDAVTVTGKGTPEIYIDGRPMREGEELKTLLSSNLKRVELLLAPGAKYESTTQAVILITTRQNFLKGVSVIDMAEVKRSRKWSANDALNLSYHGRNFEIFGSGTFAHNNSEIKGRTINRFEYQGKPMVIGSRQDNTYPGNNGSGKLGFNISTGNHNCGAYYRYSKEHGDFSNHGFEWIDDEDPLKLTITQEISSQNHLANTYYDGKFSEKLHLHFDGEYRHSSPFTESDTNTADIIDVRSTQKRKSKLYAGKLYMDNPLAGGLLTVGTQNSYTRTSMDYRMLNEEVESYIPSNLTDAKQTSLSLFASWDKSFGKFNISAGARYEYVNYLFKINGKKDNDVSRKDNFLTPDLTIGYTPDEESSISLSYKMATVKPPYSQLTSGLTYAGQYQIEGGNPALRDERMHQVQLFGMWKDFMLQSAFMRSLDTYAFVKRLYPASTPQLLLQPINIDVSSFYLFLMWGKSIGNWTPDVTVGMSTQWLEIEGVKYNKPFFNYGITNTLRLPLGLLLTANITGQSNGDMHTNRFAASWFAMDMSLRKQFFNKSLTVKLSANDIFNTINNDWSMNTYGVIVNKYQKYDGRNVTLSLTYQFQPKKSKYKGGAAAESESSRF